MIPKENHGVHSSHPVICGIDLMVLGAAVAHYGRGLDEDVLAALSWAFLNRRANGDGGEIGPAVASSPARSPARSPDWAAALMGDPLEQESARALAVFARVVAGAVADPTEGATRFHCHDETPSWAEDMDIRAVIGPYLFYANRSKG